MSGDAGLPSLQPLPRVEDRHASQPLLPHPIASPPRVDGAGNPRQVIRFTASDLQRACEQLSAGDRLHGLLARIGGDEASNCGLPRPAHLTSPGFLRRHRASLLAIALYALLAVGPGLLVSALGQRLTDQSFVKLWDWRELAGAVFLYLVLAPVLWTFYLWQPRLIVDVFDGLSRSGVIGPPRESRVSPETFLRGVGATLPRTILRRGPSSFTRGGVVAVLAALAAVATLVVWPPTAVPPIDRLVPESDLFWWRVVPFYFWAVWLPLVFVNVYMLAWIVVRQAIMIANIQRLLRLFAVDPIPFHPDRCSGFAAIGAYAVNIVRVALIVGLWALVLLFTGPATGHGLYVAPHTLFLVLVQVLLTPYLLLGPVWYAHRVMGAARDRAMERVAGRIRASLEGSPEALRSPLELASEYALTERGYHTWPFRPGVLGGISLTAGFTLIANVASLLYRLR